MLTQSREEERGDTKLLGKACVAHMTGRALCGEKVSGEISWHAAVLHMPKLTLSLHLTPNPKKINLKLSKCHGQNKK